MNVNAALPRTASIAEVAARQQSPTAPRVFRHRRADVDMIERVSRRPGHRHTLARHLRRRAVRGVVRQVHPIREPAGSYRRRGAIWNPRQCTSSDAMMRWSLADGVERPTAGDPDMVRRFPVDRAIGAADLQNTRQRYDDRRSAGRGRPSPENPVGIYILEVRVWAAAYGGPAPAAGRGAAPAAAPAPAPGFEAAISSPPGLTNTNAAGTKT